jgi:hypothetical protein
MKTLEAIKPPKINPNEKAKLMSSRLQDKLELLLYQYSFRTAAYKLRQAWDIPIQSGLARRSVINDGDKPWVSCCGNKTQFYANEWIYHTYWDWHSNHAEAIHSGEFNKRLRQLLQCFQPPITVDWLAFIFNVVVFNDPTQPPQLVTKLNSQDTLELDYLDTAGEYSLQVSTKKKPPHITVKFYRDMQDAEWKMLQARLRKELANIAPTLGSGSKSIKLLSLIADLQRMGYDDGDTASRLMDKGYNMPTQQIRIYRQRALNYGL